MNRPKNFKLAIHKIILLIAFACSVNNTFCAVVAPAALIELQLHPNTKVRDINPQLLNLSYVLKELSPATIPQQQTINLIDKLGDQTQTKINEFFTWLDDSNQYLTSVTDVNVYPEKKNALFIKSDINNFEINKIKDFLEIACTLYFIYPIKMSLAKALAAKLHESRDVSKTSAYDINIIKREAFDQLSDDCKSAVRQQYLLEYKQLLDDKLVVISQPPYPCAPQDKENYQYNETLGFLNELMAAKIIPGTWDNIRNTDMQNLPERLAQTFYNNQKITSLLKQKASETRLLNWVINQRYNPKFKDKWTDVLPKHIQNVTKISFLKLNPKAKISFNKLTSNDWLNLAYIGFIPKFERMDDTSFNEANFLNTVKKYVDDYEHWYSRWFVSNNKSTARFKALPKKFRDEFKRCYRCKNLKEGRDEWLDDDDKIIVPISTIKLYGLSTNLWDQFSVSEENIKNKDKKALIDLFKQELEMLSTLEVRENIKPFDQTNFSNTEKNDIINQVVNNLTKNMPDNRAAARMAPLQMDELTNKCIDLLQDILKQIQIKLAWAKAGIYPNQPINNLLPAEWEYLALNKRIPKLRTFSNYRQIALEYVKKYSNRWIGLKLTDSVDQKKSSLWLKALPEEFQVEVQRYFQCIKPNLALDNKNVNVPVSYLVEIGVLPKPDDATRDIIEIITREKNDSYQLADAYAKKLNTMKKNDAEKLISKMPASTLSFIAGRFALIPNHNEGILKELIKKASSFKLSAKEFIEQRNLGLTDKNELIISGNITEITQADLQKYTTAKKLILDSTALKILPDHIFDNLSNLQSINITNNTELETLPKKLFAKNVNLQEIIISGNPKLNPNKKTFEDLTAKINLLDLSNNRLTSDKLPSFAKLSIHCLKLNNNKISTIPNNIFKEKGWDAGGQIAMPPTGRRMIQVDTETKASNIITELHLQDNYLTDAGIKECSLLQKLIYLDLSNNKITNISSIISLKLPDLKYLFLAFNNLSLEEVKSKEQTQRGGWIIGPSEEIEVKKAELPMLETLDISYCKIKEINSARFKSFPGLIRIIATGNQIIDNKYNFSGLEKLQELYLGQCNITTINNSKFEKLGSLKILGLEGNLITSIPKNTFLGTSNLEHLYLFKNNIKSIETNGLTQLTQLQTLDLSYNALDIITADTFAFPLTNKLVKLNLSNNQVDIVKTEAFSSLKNIQFLNLENNGITILEAKAFSGINNKRAIKFRGNKAFGWTKPIQTLRTGVFARQIDRELYNRGQIMTATVLTGSALAIWFAPLSIPIYLTLSAAGLYSASGGLWRGVKATTNTLTNLFTGDTKLVFKFKEGLIWPKGNLELKKLDTINKYFESFRNEYNIAFSDKSSIIEHLKVGKY